MSQALPHIPFPGKRYPDSYNEKSIAPDSDFCQEKSVESPRSQAASVSEARPNDEAPEDCLLIPVRLGLERAGLGHAEVFRLLGGHLGELGADLLQMQRSDLLV